MAAGLALLVAYANRDEMGIVAYGGAALVLIGILVWAFMHHDQAKRHFVRSASAEMRADPRAPVLYLRSFASESDVAGEEEALAKIVAERGPFVAIGRPGDALPPLGATRDYLADDDWKGYVTRMLSRAALVIMVAGKTEGLGWEVSECRRVLSPERLVLLVTGDRQAFDRFRDRVTSEEAGMKLPAFPSAGETRFKAGQFAGMIRFDRNWRGSFIPFEKAAWSGLSHEMATSTTRLGDRLRLALSRTNLPREVAFRAPTFNWVRLILFVWLLAAVATLVLFAYLGLTGQLD